MFARTTAGTLVSVLLAAAWCSLLVAGCGGADSEQARSSKRTRPLQPLVYTEDPDLSPEAAAVRERRLMRRLLQGSNSQGATWGTLEENTSRDLPVPNSGERLGRVIYRALVEQSDPDWDHLFVSPAGYASLVNVEMKKARKFVDNQQAAARETRRAFAVDHPSERPKEGLSSIFEYRRLKLGEGRGLDGTVAGGDEVVVQHWNNVLELALVGGDVVFELRIPKILRIQRKGDEGRSVRLGVASDMRIGSRLDVFLEAGMHLKAALMRSFEYPIPLAVGNYWQYSRHFQGEPLSEVTSRSSVAGASDRPPTPPPSELPEGLSASKVTVKVKTVDRYDTRRLVQLRISYNDADLTRRTEYWLATPRRVYLCARPCRRHVDDLSWLLSYLRRQTPIFRFPLRRGDRWDGSESQEGSATFEVGEDWHEIDVPAGSFFGTYAIYGLGPLEGRVPAHRLREAARFVAPGKGVVRRTYRVGPKSEDVIVESLVDYRLMPR